MERKINKNAGFEWHEGVSRDNSNIIFGWTVHELYSLFDKNTNDTVGVKHVHL